MNARFLQYIQISLADIFFDQSFRFVTFAPL